MPSIQTPDRIIASSTHPVYVIDWNRLSEYGAADGLPPPVREWLETECPEVEFGRLDYPQAPEVKLSIHGNRGARITASIFIIGFDAEQADAFITDFSCSQSRLPKSPDFYLIRCAPQASWRADPVARLARQARIARATAQFHACNNAQTDNPIRGYPA